jgi:hypothetical protein
VPLSWKRRKYQQQRPLDAVALQSRQPPGVAKPDGDIMYDLFKKVRALYEKGKGAFPEPILNLKWDYETNGHFDIHKVAKEINGYDLTTGKLLPNFVPLKDDGTTSCGNWLYSGSYTEAGNMAARRKKTTQLVWDSILNGHGAGLSTEGSFTTGPPWIWMETRGIPNGPSQMGCRGKEMDRGCARQCGTSHGDRSGSILSS